jgi:hypothetical protein
MTCQVSMTGSAGVVTHRSLWLLGGLGAVLLVLAGCSSSGLHRAQAEDESEVKRYDINTVGDHTTVGNAAPMQLGGVGLVEGLEGTGGDCAHDSYRAMLADNLRKARVPDVNKLLTSSDHALVIVEALLPPGCSVGERIDVQVKLPPGSKATSLRGGRLCRCYLFNYDFARNLRPDYQGHNSLMLGNKRAVAEGPILVDCGEGDEAVRLKQGRIWNGARVIVENPLVLVMNPRSQRGAITSLITDRINASFQGSNLGRPDNRLAFTADDKLVTLRVPPQYRHNLQRFLRVVRAVPLSDSADTPSKNENDRRSYRQKLADDLLDPSRTVVAALRLEALGQSSIPHLRDRGLKSSDPLVRFCSAEALAYLGSPSCGEELYRAAIAQPLLRSYALAALSSLDENVCRQKLRELICSNYDDDIRYGAFHALRTLDEEDSAIAGEWLGESFWLHRVAPDTPPLVHVCTARRAEVVLFGETPRLKPPFSFLAGEFAVTAADGDQRCTVSRFPLQGEPARQQCGLDLEEVLRTMAELGGQYPEVLALLQQVQACESLSCRIRVDALPLVTPIEELVRAGKEPGELHENARRSAIRQTD